MQLRSNYRLYPTAGQRSALARAFGCARVVFNDALAARQQAHAAGQPYLTDAEVSARLTAAKAAPERAWLGEVSAVILQQSLADLTTAYRRFFESRTALRQWQRGGRKGPKPREAGLPRFKSRKDTRQGIRFTANARFKVLPGGTLRLPKIGDVPVRWSRPLPSPPSSVTVIRDSAGRYFASFVVQAQPGALPAAEPVVGIDLGLTHFAVLSDGRKITSPRFLLPFALRLRACCALRSLRSARRRNLGLLTLRPSDRTAKWISPRSIPTSEPEAGSGSWPASTTNEAKYRPAASRITVTDDGPDGRGRDHRTGTSPIFGRRRLPFGRTLNRALAVNRIPWRVSLRDLNRGSPASLGFGPFRPPAFHSHTALRDSKKRRYAAFRSARDCWRITAETSPSHARSGAALAAVSRADSPASVRYGSPAACACCRARNPSLNTTRAQPNALAST